MASATVHGSDSGPCSGSVLLNRIRSGLKVIPSTPVTRVPLSNRAAVITLVRLSNFIYSDL